MWVWLAVAGWIVVNVVSALLIAAIARKRRERDELYDSACEHLRALQRLQSAPAAGSEDDPPPSCPLP